VSDPSRGARHTRPQPPAGGPGAHQEVTAQAFARKGADKFAGIAWDLSPLGSPRLAGAVAWIDCEIDAIHPAGDHDIVVGAVHHLDVAHAGRPLVFANGRYHQPDLISVTPGTGVRIVGPPPDRP
jgi:flavin reductase (DIM6/NTAB) family NADH-FMN oxidoreductase RutF